MGSTSFGIVGTMPVGESSPPLEGSVFGGHAPLVGARIYILEPSTTGNPNVAGQTGASTSLMSATGNGTGGYTPILDTIAGSPGNGMYYVQSDKSGGYNLTGDYTCTQDTPVYLAAVGGTPTYAAPTATVSINGAPTISASGTTRTFTYLTPTASGYTVGQYVVVSGYTGTAGTYFNRTGYVTASSGSSFALSATYSGTATSAGSPVATVITGWNPSAVNMTALGLCPSSTSGVGFKGTLAFIYTNEVSTAALATAAGAFGTDAFHIGVATGGTVDDHYSGLYDLNALGLAINNAGLLYDITGGDLSTNPSGEGHIARSITPNGNGVTPQALMDTLGNILAACVDSGSTGTTSNISAQCEVLFKNATSTGILCTGGTGGTAPTCPTGTTSPTDIASAAFNIAHHPAGDPSNASFVSNLYGLPSGAVPFTPNLSANPSPNGQPAGQPNDFTATIAFTVPKASGSSNNNLINQPQVISIDGGNYVGDEYGGETEAAGDYQEGIWIGNFGSQAVKLFANGGIPDYAVNTAIASTTFGSRSVTLDANTPENIYFANPNTPALVEFTIGGTAVTSYNPGNGADALSIPLFAAIDGSGTMYDIYIPNYGANDLLKVTQNVFGNGVTLANVQYYNAFGGFDFYGNAAFSTTTPCLDHPASAVFDATGTLYTYGENYGYVCDIDATTGGVNASKVGFTTASAIKGPSFYSVDHSNKVWGTNAASNSLLSYKSGGALTTYTGGGLNQPCSTAVDGAGNIWVGNAGIYGVSEFSGAGVALSPIKGSATLALGGYGPQLNATYTVGGTTVFNQGGSASNCASPAIDRAGNVWVAYQGTANTFAPGVVFEILGVGAPTVTPLSYATFGNGTNGYLGVRP